MTKSKYDLRNRYEEQRNAVGSAAVDISNLYARASDFYAFVQNYQRWLKDIEASEYTPTDVYTWGVSKAFAEAKAEFESLEASAGAQVAAYKEVMSILNKRFNLTHAPGNPPSVDRGEEMYLREFVQEGA